MPSDDCTSGAERSEVDRIADEIEDRAIGPVGKDRDSGGSVALPRDRLLRWADELRDGEAETDRQERDSR